MYPQETRQGTLPEGHEFESLLTRLKSGKISETVKIAIAARYFSIGNELNYKLVMDTVIPQSPDEYTLKNNQDILVLLIKYNRTLKVRYISQAKALITLTPIHPHVNTMYLLATEAKTDEILNETYKLDRNCRYSLQLKAISYIYAYKYDEASVVIDRLPDTIDKILLEMIVISHRNMGDIRGVHRRLKNEIDKLGEISDKSLRNKYNMYISYGDRLINSGPGVLLDQIISEVSESLKISSGIALDTVEHMVEQTVKETKYAVELVGISKTLKLELEILRAQELLHKKRYTEAIELANILKNRYLPLNESASERIAIILIYSSINQKKTDNLDIPWIINALSNREVREKDVGLSDLVDLIKMKEEVPSLDERSLVWTKKMLKLAGYNFNNGILPNKGILPDKESGSTNKEITDSGSSSLKRKLPNGEKSDKKICSDEIAHNMETDTPNKDITSNGNIPNKDISTPKADITTNGNIPNKETDTPNKDITTNGNTPNKEIDTPKTEIPLTQNNNGLIWKPIIYIPMYLNRLGNIYFSNKDIQQAEQMYTKALSICTPEQSQDIQDNLNLLIKYKNRPDTDISTCPEAMCLYKSQGYTNTPTTTEYINNLIYTNTTEQSANNLYELAMSLLNQTNSTNISGSRLNSTNVSGSSNNISGNRLSSNNISDTDLKQTNSTNNTLNSTNISGDTLNSTNISSPVVSVTNNTLYTPMTNNNPPYTPMTNNNPLYTLDTNERILNILSLCSLVLYNKPIISQYDISHSNISVIYNHIVYWSNNHTVIDIDIINTVIYYCISQYTTESQRLVAYHTVILLLRYTRYNINIFTYIYNKVHIYIQEHKEYSDILSIWQDIQDIYSTDIDKTKDSEIQQGTDISGTNYKEIQQGTDINMTKSDSTDIEKTKDSEIQQDIYSTDINGTKKDSTDISGTKDSKLQQDTDINMTKKDMTKDNMGDLQTKREEVMRMLMETGKKKEKKEKKEEGDKKMKRVKREKKEENEVKKKVKMSEREEKEGNGPVLIKKASHTVVSSDEEE